MTEVEELEALNKANNDRLAARPLCYFITCPTCLGKKSRWYERVPVSTFSQSYTCVERRCATCKGGGRIETDPLA